MTELNEHLDEGTIHAWLDGALSPDESARVERHAGVCPDCATLVAEARGLIAASSRILSSLDAVPAGVIPGSASKTDQLAALRARKRAATRRWWNDPRFVAAASLVFIAGTFSVVWRVNHPETDTITQTTVGAASRSAPVVPPSASDARREAAAAPPPAAPAPARVAANQRRDSVSKTEPTADVGSARGAAATNEPLRRDVEAKVAVAQSAPAARDRMARAVDSVAAERAAPPPATVEALRDSFVRAPTNRARSLSAPQAAMGGLRSNAPALSLPVGCYELRALNSRRQPVSHADTVRLLSESPRVLSDPTWYFASPIAGTLPGDLSWRPVDSITVELKIQSSDTTLARFQTAARSVRVGGQVVMTMMPDTTGLRDVRPLWAAKVDCR